MKDNKPELTDQQKRQRIPTIADVPSLYRPCLNLLMVVPLADIEKVGGIIIPDTARKQLNEGHIVAMGPLCGAKLEVGDCITWDEHSENRMNVDGFNFILVNESQVAMRIPKAELEAAYAAEIGLKIAPRPEPAAHSSAPEREDCDSGGNGIDDDDQS